MSRGMSKPLEMLLRLFCPWLKPCYLGMYLDESIVRSSAGEQIPEEINAFLFNISAILFEVKLPSVFKTKNNKLNLGAGEMWWLSGKSSGYYSRRFRFDFHMVANNYTFSSSRFNVFWPLLHQACKWCIDMCRQNTHRIKKKKNQIFLGLWTWFMTFDF